MQKLNINIPEGTRDTLYDEAVLSAEVLYRLDSVYLGEGFTKISTPTLEYYDVFNFSGQPMPQENMYKLTDNNGRLLVLRPDSTTPIARVAATKLKNTQLPLKLCYSQNIYRINLGYSGRRNEITQSGVEIIGLSGIKSDMLCITTAIKALEALDVDFKIEIGHVDFYNSIIAELELSDEERELVRSYVDSKNAVSLGFIRDTAGIDRIMQIPLLFGGAEVFDKAKTVARGNKEALVALESVQNIYNLLEDAGFGDRVLIDLGIVHKLDYYTGIVFRGFIDGAGEPVLGGGRYDNLVKTFGHDMPATGFAINACAVSEALQKSGKVNCTQPKASCILHYDSVDFPAAEKMKASLEREGKIVELSCFDDVEQTREYALNKGIKELIVLSGKDTKSYILMEEKV